MNFVHQKDCPFCEKTTADFFIESKGFATIYNISPIVPGHSLVIPKFHCESVLELSEHELEEFMGLCRKATKLLCRIFHTDAFDWAIQEKEAAGQSVPHLHMHIVPRKMGDLPKPGDWFQKIDRKKIEDIDTYDQYRLSEEELSLITSQLKEYSQEK